MADESADPEVAVAPRPGYCPVCETDDTLRAEKNALDDQWKPYEETGGVKVPPHVRERRVTLAQALLRRENCSRPDLHAVAPPAEADAFDDVSDDDEQGEEVIADDSEETLPAEGADAAGSGDASGDAGGTAEEPVSAPGTAEGQEKEDGEQEVLNPVETAGVPAATDPRR